jgi:nucleoside-diphosphate-sugar epimerase
MELLKTDRGMKVALIGSNSFLAQYILREFLQFNITPELFGLFKNPENPELVFHRFQWPDFPINLASLLNFDIIVYTAGAGIQADLQEPRELIYELNSFLPIRILNFLSVNNFRGKVITFGSYFEIGNEPEPHYYTEEEVAVAQNHLPNHYASSKRILTRHLASSPYLPLSYHFILPNIYGKGENPARLIPYLINSVKQGTEIKLTSGYQVRQYLHAADIARVVLLVSTTSHPGGLYNLCNREPVPIRSLVERVFTIMGREAEFQAVRFGNNQRTDTSMPFLLLNNDKAQVVLDFLPSVSLEDGINSYL